MAHATPGSRRFPAGHHHRWWKKGLRALALPIPARLRTAPLFAGCALRNTRSLSAPAPPRRALISPMGGAARSVQPSLVAELTRANHLVGRDRDRRVPGQARGRIDRRIFDDAGRNGDRRANRLRAHHVRQRVGDELVAAAAGLDATKHRALRAVDDRVDVDFDAFLVRSARARDLPEHPLRDRLVWADGVEVDAPAEKRDDDQTDDSHRPLLTCEPLADPEDLRGASATPPLPADNAATVQVPSAVRKTRAEPPQSTA